MRGKLRRKWHDFRRKWIEFRGRFERDFKVGRHTILLPPGHALDRHRLYAPRYDTALGLIAACVAAKYPDMLAVDIGANIGDSAALLRRDAEFPVLCIEGDPEYWDVLDRNAARVGNVRIEHSFVGAQEGSIPAASIRRKAGTSSIAGAPDAGGAELRIPIRPLADIVRPHEASAMTRLLKIDTDGFDFQILGSSMAWLRSTLPVIFFEFDILFPNCGRQDALEVVDQLMAAGYSQFSIYANTGEYLLSVDRRDQFEDLCTWLDSESRRKGPTRGIVYFDVCAYSSRDADLWSQVRQKEAGH